MNKFFLILICLITINSISRGQDYGKVHQLIIEGIDAEYDVDFNLALTKFQEAKSIAPGDLRGPFFESTVFFWKAMLSRSKSDYETFMNLSDKIVEKCENVVDKNENDLDAKLYLGWIYTMRAFSIGFLGDNYLKAASEIKDGNGLLRTIIEKNPSYYDAYLGLGIYNYVISFIPRKLQWLTTILGFSGDREEGKKMLAIASEKGIYTSSEAKFYMTILLWREESYPQAESYATSLKNKYPKSPAVWMLWGGLLSQQDKMNDAIEAYEKSLEYNKGKESDIIYKTAYGSLGTAYFRLNIYDKATEYGKRYISYLTKDENMNNRLHSIGVSLEFMGNRNEALEYYRKARTDFKDENEWEKFWLRKLRQREANPISKTDSLLIAADNNKSVGKINEALSDYNTLNSANGQTYSDDIKVQVNHGLALTYYKQKDYNKAIDLFKANLSLNPADEKYLVPEACFQIGRCYLKLGNKSEAQKYFDKIDEYDFDYDFKDSMDGKIKNELSKK